METEKAGSKREKKGESKKQQKSYFDVLGICCTSEVPLVEKILNSLPGVLSVSVIVPSRTVIVVHDTSLVSQIDIVKALNQARLQATVRQYGKTRRVRNWPSPYTMACGALLLLSVLKLVYQPLRWLAVAAAIAGLPPILHRALAAARRFTLDINILMLIAVGGSIALKDYWEAGSIVFLFTIAEWLESRASYRATSAMTALTSMLPSTAVLSGTGEVVDPSTVKVDTKLAVKAGEIIPIDGVVVDGRCEVDESSLTGESFPVPKLPRSQVWAGTLNIHGYVTVKTTALAQNSAVAKMTKLVEEAQNARSKTQRIVDSCAKYYTPGLVATAALLVVIPLAMKAADMKRWLRLALVLVVSACPCALVLSTPVATFCALSSAAKSGLLVKGGDFLETLGRVKLVAFDKTGTITTGQFSVLDFHPVGGNVSFELLLYWVSSVESKASHPMAAALVEFARLKSVEPKTNRVGGFQMFPGEGVYGEIDGRSLYIGNQRIASRAGCARQDWGVGKDLRGATAGYVFSGGELIGIFSLSDTCRAGVAEAIEELNRMQIKTAMLTGDSTTAAVIAQKQLGNALGEIHSELLPEDKVRLLKDLRAKEGRVVMVGDGINDAPALLAADVGVSMGISGSAVAMETSQITLMSNDVRKIPAAIRLGRRTRCKIIENIVLSVTTKSAILALALSGHPLLWAAVVADVGTCLLVIFNSMLLLNSPAKSRSHSHSDQKKCSAHGRRLNLLCCNHGHDHEHHHHAHDHDHDHENHHHAHDHDHDHEHHHHAHDCDHDHEHGHHHHAHHHDHDHSSHHGHHHEHDHGSQRCHDEDEEQAQAGSRVAPEEREGIDLCSHRQEEVECLRYIACERPSEIVVAVRHPRNICPCGDFHKRHRSGSCRSHHAGALAGLPQLREIVTE